MYLFGFSFCPVDVLMVGMICVGFVQQRLEVMFILSQPLDLKQKQLHYRTLLHKIVTPYRQEIMRGESEAKRWHGYNIGRTNFFVIIHLESL